MKFAEKAVERVLQIAEEVQGNRRNARNALAEANIIDVAGRIAFYHTNHQRLQKKTPKVRFFDSEVPKPEAVEELVGTKVSGTLTVRSGKKTSKVKVTGKR